MNRDFVEMLSELSGAGAEFLVIGAHALAAHGIPRATGDVNKRASGRPKDLADLTLLAGEKEHLRKASVLSRRFRYRNRTVGAGLVPARGVRQ